VDITVAVGVVTLDGGDSVADANEERSSAVGSAHAVNVTPVNATRSIPNPTQRYTRDMALL
jgi:hypothetical protein